MTSVKVLLLLVAVVFILTILSASTIRASSPAEPAFKSQLRSCFESNRNTECLSSSSSWSSCGGSMFSSYGNAVSVSMNCMRSVCGNQNGLCCNTYCTMFGLSGNDHSNCFNRCFNPNYGYVATTAAATTLSNVPFDDDADFAPKSSDDKTIVKCSVSCDATYAFYFANEEPSRKERKFLRSLLGDDSSSSSSTLSTAQASVLRKIRNAKRYTKRFTQKLITNIGKRWKSKKEHKKIKAKKLKERRQKLQRIKERRQKLQIFDIPLMDVLPIHPVYESKLVGQHQICNNVKKSVEVTYYKRSRVSCKKIKRWMTDVSMISPNNLLAVYKFMMIVHNKCRGLVPKKSKQCVVPMFRRINLNTDVL